LSFDNTDLERSIANITNQINKIPPIPLRIPSEDIIKIGYQKNNSEGCNKLFIKTDETIRKRIKKYEKII
jgi:hypothetical protein